MTVWIVCRTSKPWAFAATTSACAAAGTASAVNAKSHFMSGRLPISGGRMARQRLAVEDRVDLRRHLFDGRHAVDPAHQPALLVVWQDRLGLGAVFGHP